MKKNINVNNRFWACHIYIPPLENMPLKIYSNHYFAKLYHHAKIRLTAEVQNITYMHYECTDKTCLAAIMVGSHVDLENIGWILENGERYIEQEKSVLCVYVYILCIKMSEDVTCMLQNASA